MGARGQRDDLDVSYDLLTPEERERADAAEAAQNDLAPKPRKNTTRKGKRGERRAVKLWGSLGVRARRQPRSGSIEGLPHDVVGDLAQGQTVTSEVKWFGASRWKTLDRWLAGADVLILYTDQEAVGVPAPEAKLFMPASTLARLMEYARNQPTEG